MEEKEKHLAFLKDMVWENQPDDFDFDTWEETHDLFSDVPWHNKHEEDTFGQDNGISLSDPLHLLDKTREAIQYTIDQVDNKQYENVLEINDLLSNLSFWFYGPAAEMYDGPVILEHLAISCPNLKIDLDSWGKHAFIAVYNSTSEEQRVEKVYDFLYSYKNAHWNTFSLLELRDQFIDQLPDFDKFIPKLDQYIKKKESNSWSWGRNVSSEWGDDLFILQFGQEKFLKKQIAASSYRLHMTEKGAQKIQNALDPDHTIEDIEEYCVQLILSDESTASWEKESVHVHTICGDFKIHPTTFTISLLRKAKSVKR